MTERLNNLAEEEKLKLHQGGMENRSWLKKLGYATIYF
jgi:hypothetical protein